MCTQCNNTPIFSACPMSIFVAISLSPPINSHSHRGALDVACSRHAHIAAIWQHPWDVRCCVVIWIYPLALHNSAVFLFGAAKGQWVPIVLCF